MPATARNEAFILVDGENLDKHNCPLYGDVFGVLPKTNETASSNSLTLHTDESRTWESR